MNYKKEKYINKEIQLYPGTNAKYGIIRNIDDLGWTIEITESECKSFKVGETYFISHSSAFTFSFIERKVIFISNIEWDTDADDYEDDYGLPDTIHITVTPEISYLLDDIDGEAENLVNYLSDNFGWCIKGFSVEVE